MRGIAIAVMLLVLAGCASAPSTRLATHPGPTAFTINGRILVKYDGEHSSANLHWKHHAGDDDVLLLAPLGVTVAHIQRDSQGARLETSGKLYTAHDSDELMQQVLGWHLPLEGLQYWVLAQPHPGAPADEVRNGNGQPQQLQQDGWLISYARYDGEARDSLPLLLTLQREGLEIRLVVDEWQM